MHIRWRILLSRQTLPSAITDEFGAIARRKAGIRSPRKGENMRFASGRGPVPRSREPRETATDQARDQEVGSRGDRSAPCRGAFWKCSRNLFRGRPKRIRKTPASGSFSCRRKPSVSIDAPKEQHTTRPSVLRPSASHLVLFKRDAPDAHLSHAVGARDTTRHPLNHSFRRGVPQGRGEP